jgi:phosphatidylglycerol lysyltransferase
VDPVTPDRIVSLASAAGMLLLAVGLARRKRAAWWYAVAVFSAGLLAQSLVLHHVGGTLLAAICLALLLLQRPRYRVSMDATWRPRVLIATLAGLAGAIGLLALALSWTGVWTVPAVGVTDLGEELAAWLAFARPEGVAVAIARHGVVPVLISLGARVSLVLGVLASLRPVASAGTDHDLEAQAIALAQRTGGGALLPFQTGSGLTRFVLRGTQGAVAFRRAGRHAVVLGDPLGTPGEAWLVFDAFLSACDGCDWVPVVYQAGEDARGHLVKRGFNCLRIGEEAIVDVDRFSLAGAARANLRHTVTRAQRGGITVRVFPDGLPPQADGLRAGLEAVDADWRGASRGSMQFTVGEFEPQALPATPLAVALDSEAEPVAFITLRRSGADAWVLDLVRRRPGSTPGAIESCLIAFIGSLRERGAKILSLGLAPLSGLEHGPRGAERLLLALRGVVRPIYDVEGLRFFKAKFDPTWVPRYLAVRRNAELPGALAALVDLHFGGMVQIARLATAELKAHSHRSMRRTA